MWKPAHLEKRSFGGYYSHCWRLVITRLWGCCRYRWQGEAPTVGCPQATLRIVAHPRELLRWRHIGLQRIRLRTIAWTVCIQMTHNGWCCSLPSRVPLILNLFLVSFVFGQGNFGQDQAWASVWGCSVFNHTNFLHALQKQLGWTIELCLNLLWGYDLLSLNRVILPNAFCWGRRPCCAPQTFASGPCSSCAGWPGTRICHMSGVFGGCAWFWYLIVARLKPKPLQAGIKHVAQAASAS